MVDPETSVFSWQTNGADAGQLAIVLRANGQADAHGVILLGHEFDRDRPIVLIPQSATATCADTNGDGVAGLVSLVVLLLDVQSRDEIIGIVRPVGGADITDFGVATLELVGERLRATVVGEVSWRHHLRRHLLTERGRSK